MKENGKCRCLSAHDAQSLRLPSKPYSAGAHLQRTGETFELQLSEQPVLCTEFLLVHNDNLVFNDLLFTVVFFIADAKLQ